MTAPFRGAYQPYGMPPRGVLQSYPAMPAHRAQSLLPQQSVPPGSGAPAPREFDPNDFPALGAPNQSSQSQSQETHSQGMNGFQQQGQDQQHRQSLLGSIPGAQQQQQSQQQQGLMSSGQPRLHGFSSDSEKRTYALKSTHAAAWNAASSVQQPGFHPGITNGAQSHTPQHLLLQQQTSSSINAPPGVPPPGYSQAQPHVQQHPIGGPQFSTAAQMLNQSDPHASPQPQHGNGPPASAGSSQAAGLPQTPAQQILMSPADRWGLLGLLALIKSTDPDINLLSYGQDLGTMGMDMNAPSHISSSFITPWSDSSAAHTVEPDFHLPHCYAVQPAPPGPNKAAAFSDETLFFMFYSSPRDALQEIAALELYNRNWRFHKDLRLWLTKEAGTSPSQKIPGGETGLYTFWDPDNWERQRKNMTLAYADLEEKAAPATTNATHAQYAGLPHAQAFLNQQGAQQGQGTQNSAIPHATAQSLQIQQQVHAQQVAASAQRGFQGMGMTAIAGL